jgi:sigma-B regulation protein RsbU (phosphoserine phosphatase)
MDKVRGLLADIRAAFHRIEDHSFGTCQVCKDEVEYDRLEVQPVRQICLGCISEAERSALEDELTIASRIHRALLPQQVEKIEGYEIGVKSLAAQSVGGDYYDFLSSPSGGMKVVVADSMGKGIPAGLLMSNLQGALRVLAPDISLPGALLGKLNWWLCRNVPVSKFISLICIDLAPSSSPASTSVRYASAGHPPAILARADGSCTTLHPTGGVLGVHEQFDYEDQPVQIDPGDLLLLYTDGVTEAENDRGDMFGEERLAAFCREQRTQPVGTIIERLLESVRAFSGRDTHEDDLTVIAIRKR